MTESGRAIAEMIRERHELLTKWLTKLGVPETIASEDACKMEHTISKETLSKLHQFLQKQKPLTSAQQTNVLKKFFGKK